MMDVGLVVHGGFLKVNGLYYMASRQTVAGNRSLNSSENVDFATVNDQPIQHVAF